MAGHIRKREWIDGDGKRQTRYQARIPSPTNRRKDVVKTFKLKKHAERWLSAQATSIDRGDFIDHRRGATPFRQVADEWREAWAALAPKTRVGYESILNRHVLPAFGSARVASIGPKDVQDFMNVLAASRSPNTVRRVMDVVRNVLRIAVERRYIRRQPLRRSKAPAQRRGSRHRYQPSYPHRATRPRRGTPGPLPPAGPTRRLYGSTGRRALGAPPSRRGPAARRDHRGRGTEGGNAQGRRVCRR
jgi:hypothetical protein